MEKQCYTCKILKSVDQFGLDKRRSDGLKSNCNQCQLEYNRKYGLQYREKQKTERLVALYDWRKTNPEKQNQQLRRRKKKLKLEVLSHYSNALCCPCGEMDVDCLSIDHINGGGRMHRKQLGIKGSTDFYLWLKKSNYPNEFQVLCMNCQWRKKLQTTTEKSKKLKLEVLSHYGTFCPCGEHDLRCLSIDHVNNDGSKYRRMGKTFYHYLKRLEFPNDPPLQVLCMNCQWKKEIKNRS